MEELMRTMRQALPDLRFRVEDILAEGDQAAARVTRRGTQRGELMGIPATGRSVAWDEIFVARVAGGKIAEGWAVEDKFGLMQQLGAVPAGGHGGHGGHH